MPVSAGCEPRLAACAAWQGLRLDYAVERTICPWWLLHGWEPDDVEALKNAVIRAQEAARAEP